MRRSLYEYTRCTIFDAPLRPRVEIQRLVVLQMVGNRVSCSRKLDASSAEIVQADETRLATMLSSGFSACQQLRADLTSLRDAASTLADACRKLDTQCCARLGADWRDIGDDDLTPQKADDPRIALHDNLIVFVRLVESIAHLWDKAAPSCIDGVVKLLSGESVETQEYIKHLQIFSKTYTKFETQRVVVKASD